MSGHNMLGFLSLNMVLEIAGAVLVGGIALYLYPIGLHYWRRRKRARPRRAKRT